MFAIAVNPVRNPSVGDRFITAQRRRLSASRLRPDRESSLVLLLVWSKIFRTITNDTCDTLKCSGKYAHHFLYFALILCLCLPCNRWDGHWKRNSSCLSLRLFLFITKQQLLESQIIPVYHKRAAVSVPHYSCLSGKHINTAQSVCLSVCTHITSEYPLVVSSRNFVFVDLFQVWCRRSVEVSCFGAFW